MTSKFKMAAVGAGLAVLAAALYVAGMYKKRADRWHAQWAAVREEANLLRAGAPTLHGEPRPEPVPAAPAVAEVARAEAADPAQQDRIRQLETALAEKDRVIRDLQAAATNRPPPEERRRREPAEWMEELRRNDPARYEEFQKRREERQREQSKQFAEKAAYFLQRDTAKMGGEEKESYNLMLQLLDETWRLSEQMRADMPPDQRRDLRQALREKAEVLNPLLAQERTRTFIEAGLEVGYSETEAADFAEYLNEIIELTSPRGMFRGGPPGGWGAGGPGGPPPGP